MVNVAFRVDASDQIGTGHFMRCLTLANQLKLQQVKVRFVSRHLPAHFRDMLEQQSIEFVALKSTDTGILSVGDLAHAGWLHCSQYDDAQDALQALDDQVWDWLVVDHYSLDERWESRLRSVCKQILVIDDIADRRHDCDVLLDQNLYVDMGGRYAGKVPQYCRQLLGPRFALLREEFDQARKAGLSKQLNSNSVRRILIFFGGIDAGNFTSHAMDAVARIGQGFYVDVVIGAHHPYKLEIEEKCTKYHFSCHVQTTRFAELLALADLSIGAGGTAVWERACLGVPTFAIATALNQSEQLAVAASEGLVYAPEFSTKEHLGVWMERHVRALLENNHLRVLLSRRAKQMVDTFGVSRVIANLGVGGIKLRVAETLDSQNIFEWRNHIKVRKASRDSRLISWEEHQQWFESVLVDPNKILLVGYEADHPVGVVRFDFYGEQAEISIYVIQGSALTGQGYNLLLSAERWVVRNGPHVKCIQATVLGDNMRSQRLFSEAGYSLQLSHYLKDVKND